MFKNLFRQLLIVAVLSMSACLASPAYCEQEENVYSKVAYNYIVKQADVVQHSFTNNTYSVEAGINIVKDEYASSRLGIYYFDHIGMSSLDEDRYSAQLVEVFGEESFDFGDYYFRIGLGYKIYQDAYIRKACTQFMEQQVLSSQADRISSRFSIGKRVGNWEIEVSHHSNYLVGKPFNNRWEYNQTSLSVGYVFNLGSI